MANIPIEVKKPAPAKHAYSDSFAALRQEMDHLFDRFTAFPFQHFWRGSDHDKFWGRDSLIDFSVPAVDVTEDDKEYRITAELPGIEEKDLDVSVIGDTLVIKGEKHQEKEVKGKNRYLSERTYGAFQRSFALPDDVERAKVAASFAKGVLTLSLPKTDAAKKQTKIEVKAA